MGTDETLFRGANNLLANKHNHVTSSSGNGTIKYLHCLHVCDQNASERIADDRRIRICTKTCNIIPIGSPTSYLSENNEWRLRQLFVDKINIRFLQQNYVARNVMTSKRSRQATNACLIYLCHSKFEWLYPRPITRDMHDLSLINMHRPSPRAACV